MENDMNFLNNSVTMWERRRKLLVIQAICYVVYYYWNRCKSRSRYFIEQPSKEERLQRKFIRSELLDFLQTNKKGRDVIRMNRQAFTKLCNELRKVNLGDTQRSTIEEQVSMFLHILALPAKNRTLQFFYRRSGETISRHFHRVLKSIILLEDKYIRQPDGSEIPDKIRNSHRFYPYFKDCVGAIDGTHIRVKVNSKDAPRYRGRKEYPTQNVLAACSFDLKFTYVLPGWEGTASDSRIIKNALVRKDKLNIPKGKYYLVDAGFMLKGGLIAPYRGVRYHLKEYSKRAPENARELFNHRHASLRNTIERAFGVVKKRFPIIGGGTEPTYSVETQTEIILACCILHNFLMDIDPDEDLIRQVDREILNQSQSEGNNSDEENDEDTRRGELIRDHISSRMWNDYHTN